MNEESHVKEDISAYAIVDTCHCGKRLSWLLGAMKEQASFQTLPFDVLALCHPKNLRVTLGEREGFLN